MRVRSRQIHDYAKSRGMQRNFVQMRFQYATLNNFGLLDFRYNIGTTGSCKSAKAVDNESRQRIMIATSIYCASYCLCVSLYNAVTFVFDKTCT